MNQTLLESPPYEAGIDSCVPSEVSRIGTDFPVSEALFAQRDTLFAEFTPLVHRLIAQYSSVPSFQGDLLGEIYFRFCALLDAFDPGRGIPLKPYLVRQLNASIYTYVRREWRQRQREVSVETYFQTRENLLADDPTRGWDEAMALQQMQDKLPFLLQQVPMRQKQVIIWRYYDEWSFEEIAAQLGVKPATARSLLRHGLAKMRHLLAQEIGELPEEAVSR